MALHRIGASSACVVAVESKAMHPTIVHVETIIGDNRSCAGRYCWGSGCWSHRLVCGLHQHAQCFKEGCMHTVEPCCCMHTVEPCLACGELVQMPFVFYCEVFSKFNESLCGKGADAPGVACSGEDTSCLKHEEGEIFDGIVS